MATRTLSQMRTRLMRITGQDSNDSELIQIVDDYINRAYQDVVRRHAWNWLRKEGMFNTVAPVSSGNISGSGSQITGSGTNFGASMEGYYLQVEDLGQSTYQILDVTSSTSLTINGTLSADVTASNYVIFKADYALAIGPDEGYIDYIEDTNYSQKIYPITANNMEEAFPNFGGVSRSNSPSYFSIVGRNNLNQVLIRLFPLPQDARTMRYVAFDSRSDLATANDSPLVPERFQEVIEEGALARIYLWQGRKDLFDVHSQLYESYIQNMMQQDKNERGVIFPREDNDLPKSRQGRGLRLPPEYGGTIIWKRRI